MHLQARATLAVATALALAAPATHAVATSGHRAQPGSAHPDTRHQQTATPPPVTGTGCVEHEAWVDGDTKAVAAALPASYTAVTDGNGDPIVFARAERCDAINDGGAAHPVVVADWGIVVDTRDGTGCSSGIPRAGAMKGDLPPACNWYTLGLATDDQRIVSWLRQGTPSIPAVYAPEIVYRQSAPDPTGQTTFHFASGTGLPWTFTLDDTSSFRPGAIALRGNYWFATPHGTVRMLVSTDDLTTGTATTTLSAPAKSALARLMGATARQSVQPYAQFGVIAAAHGVLRKQLLAPPRAGEQLTSYDGTCSVQGDVTFTPPAGDQQRPTVYSYTATGTCTGTLNGRSLNNAPIKLHQSGHADASCMQALSFPPGTGVVDFPGNIHLPYTLDFESDGTELNGTAYGTRSGLAFGHASFLTQRSSPTLITDCAAGAARKAPMDLTFTTNSPMVSDT